MRVAAILLVAVLVSGCGASRAGYAPSSAGSPSASPEDLTDLLQRGCFQCLESAYEGAMAGEHRGAAFEAAALLTLRSKELGLPFDVWQARAQELGLRDPAWGSYLDIISAIPSDPMSGGQHLIEETEGRMRARKSITFWRDELKHGALSPLFRAYLDLALVCAFGTLDVNADSFSGPLDPMTETPLYQYRLGLCGVSARERLGTLKAHHPEFVDADYALGRAEVEDPIAPDPESGLKHLELARAAFPASAAIVTTIGNVHRAWEDWEAALVAYDLALARTPDHPEAAIGRIICLSRLSRSAEAISAATALIDHGRQRRGEAHYWRAWNHLTLGDYDAARADADRARSLMVNSAVFVLSGTVDWRLRKLTSAEADFQQALTIDFGECEAAFDLAVVRDELGKQREALAAFQQARQCLDLSRTLRREAITKINAGPGSATMKARAAAIHERVLAELDERSREVERALSVLEKVVGGGE
ncbi:MAG: tetratricopeptide repeat protein [Vicinamibacterales bacterium]